MFNERKAARATDHMVTAEVVVFRFIRTRLTGQRDCVARRLCSGAVGEVGSGQRQFKTDAGNGDCTFVGDGAGFFCGVAVLYGSCIWQ